MRIIVIGAVATLLGIGGSFAQGKDVSLSAASDKVFAVLVEVVAKEYRLEHVSKDTLTVSFRSGASMRSMRGQDASCVVLPADDGARSLVVCNTEKRDRAFAWGEGGKVQEKVLRLLTKALHKRELIPAAEVVK